MEPTPIVRAVQHGEGPHWDYNTQSLYYVDTFTATVFKFDPNTKKTTYHKFDGDSVGFMIPIKNKPNNFIICRDRYINLLKWDGLNNNTGMLEDLTYVDHTKHNNQFNDGKVDAKGRLWAGTLTRNKDLSVTTAGGTLYLIKGGRSMTIESKISPVCISNGLAWSKDNRRLFYIDSGNRKIISYHFDLETGNIDSPQTLFDLKHYPSFLGILDGMTIDTDDTLWVALFGGKSVLKVNSTSGQLLQVINMPVTYPTSVTFGGSAFDVLYVSTSRLKLTEQELLKEPTAGSVFAVYNLGVRGYPANHFKL